MTTNDRRKNTFLEPGTQVRYDGLGKEHSEFGIVIHCWYCKDCLWYDCYVAFFGDKFPNHCPKEKPYILRYATTSLHVVQS
ncbi:MAG: hypothetical protein L3J05_08330 [Robiginitomaculum sp.]|nr:hypothetical protein [Robiginitomaculum sp.]